MGSGKLKSFYCTICRGIVSSTSNLQHTWSEHRSRMMRHCKHAKKVVQKSVQPEIKITTDVPRKRARGSGRSMEVWRLEVLHEVTGALIGKKSERAALESVAEIVGRDLD